jgi:hypothetical protein
MIECKTLLFVHVNLDSMKMNYKIKLVNSVTFNAKPAHKIHFNASLVVAIE